MDDRPPRVFVSYSDDSPRHAERVLELAQWLRTLGIDAHIDQFEESPEQGWPRWVYSQMRESEYVLVVCTRGYLERCEGEVPRGRRADRAVKFESHLSLQEIHDAEGRNRKFIPLVFDHDDVGECVPLPLRSTTHYRLPVQRDDLYRRLSDQPKIRPVPLGALRTLDDDSLDGLLLVDPRESSASHSPDPSASHSLDAIIITDDAPPKRRKRAWSSGQLQRLMTVGAFGLAFLTTALFINSTLTTTNNVGGDPNCRIELTDPNGDAIDSDFIRLELTAGQEIEFQVENGNTLRFKCPTVAVQARVRVDPNSKSQAADSPTIAESAASDTPDHGESRSMLGSTFTITPEAGGVQTVRLGPLAQEVPDPEIDPKPDPETDLGDRSEPAPGSDLGLGSLGATSSQVDGQVAKKRAPSKPKFNVELSSVTPKNTALERKLEPMLERLEACATKTLSVPVDVTCRIQQDAAGTIVNVTIDDAALRKHDRDAADCAQREISSWAPGEVAYEPARAVSQATLRFSDER